MGVLWLYVVLLPKKRTEDRYCGRITEVNKQVYAWNDEQIRLYTPDHPEKEREHQNFRKERRW
ncbi:MAG: hypothetical protein K6G07_01900 [Lachnospiraceae bacterium]|nr:hypothetical protein [Lachnospiraceae bacterium]